MKFILFNINDTTKNVVNKIQFDDTHYINEVSLSKEILENMDKEPQGIISKIKYNICNKNIEKKIFKALEGHAEKWYYILANNIPNNKYLFNKLEGLLGYKLTGTNELDANIFKYVDEYLKENKTNKMKKHELKVLLVATANKSLNFSLITNLINEYKNVNIYLKEKPSNYTLKRIKQINKDEGTTIEIVKKERKAFAEYNVVYFVDDSKENYPRLRLDKNALVIDVTLAKMDKYNSNILFINRYMEKDNNIKASIEKLSSVYNRLELAGVIRKIINDLDKL